MLDESFLCRFIEFLTDIWPNCYFSPLCFCFFITTYLLAQTSNPKKIVKQARRDVRHFKLNRTDYKKFRKDRRNPNSDFFKPVNSMVRDTTLLKDSTYVKAFRTTAYMKTRSRHANTIICIVGGTLKVGSVSAFFIFIGNLNSELEQF